MLADEQLRHFVFPRKFGDCFGGVLGIQHRRLDMQAARESQMTLDSDASLFAEQFAAARRVSGGPVDAACAERPNVGDHLPDLIAREEDAGHSGTGDAIGDVEKNVGVSGAVEEYAGLEVG